MYFADVFPPRRRSLIFADVPGIKRHSAAMNAGDAYTLFAGMLTQRPWELIEAGSAKLDHLTVPTDAKSRAQLAGYAAQYAGDIARLLLRMPRELLLLLKTNDCLRSLDATLGQPLNNFLITARYVSRALAEERLAAKPGLKTRLAVIGEVGALEARLWLLQLMAGRGGGRSRAQPGGGSSTAAAPAPPRQQQATAGTQRAPEQAALPALTT